MIPFPAGSMWWWCLCKRQAQQHILVPLSFTLQVRSAPGQSMVRKGQIWSWIAHLSCAAVNRGKPSGWDGGREPVAAVPRVRFLSAMQKLGCAELFLGGLCCVRKERAIICPASEFSGLCIASCLPLNKLQCRNCKAEEILCN